MKYFLSFFLLGLARANPIIVPEQSVVVPEVVAPIAKDPVVPVIGIIESVQNAQPVVPLVNAPKVVESVIEEVKAIVPDVPIPQESKQGVVPVIAPVVEEKIIPAAPVAPIVSAPIAPIGGEIPVIAPVVEKKEPVAAVAIIPQEQEAGVESKHQDPSVILSDPIDKVTKLVIDLDEHVRKYLPSEEEPIPQPVPPAQVYAGGEGQGVGAVAAESDEISGGVINVVRQNQMSALIDQVNRLAESIENTITDLVARRRYVTAAMLRSMLNYVRRVRVNLERLQNRLQSVQAVATSGQNSPQGGSPPIGIPGTAFFNTIRDRINRITEEIGALVSRIRGSFTPLGATTASPLPPLQTAANIAADIAQHSAAANIATNIAATVQGSGVVQAASVVSS